MILDIIVAVIVIGAMAIGFRNGFVHTFFHMAGWALAFVAAFFCVPGITVFLTENTGVYASMRESLLEQLSDAAMSRHLVNALPDLLRGAAQAAIEQAAEIAATLLADMLIAIVSFLLAVVVIKLTLWIVARALSKKRVKGTRGFFDGLLGLVLGFVKGMLLVFVLLAVMVPIAGLIDSAYTDFLLDSLRASYFAGTLYDNNLIVLIVRDFLT